MTVASLTPKAAAKPDKPNLQLATAAIQAALTLKDQPVFPDMNKNYESYKNNMNNCAASGGTFSITGCDIPPPPPPPVVEAPPAVVTLVQSSGSCASWMNQAGIIDQAIAIQVINIESGCNPNSVNASSGACGLGQQLPCGKWPHQWNDPVGSLIDMQNYVYGSYGSWSSALIHEHVFGWY